MSDDSSQPQRGCVPQPKVAVLGYLGSRDSNGVRNPKPGCALIPKITFVPFNIVLP